MKKFYLLTKTLLVAALLMVGANAWADSKTVSLTESELATLYPNNEVANYFDFVSMAKAWNDAAEGDKATYAVAAGSGTYKVNKIQLYQVANPASMNILSVQAVGTTNAFSWRWDTSKAKYGLQNWGNARILSFAVTKGQIIVMEGGYTATATGSCAADYAANSGYNTFTATEDGKIAFSTAGAHVRALAILNPSASAVSYTVKYVDELGTEIKDATEGTGEAGASITVTAAEKSSFKNVGETKKYIYKSDDSEGKVIASDGSTIVTITFREAATYSYTVNAMNGETKLEELATGSTFELDNVTVPFHKYYNIDGTLYTKDAISSEYRQVVTIDEDDKVVGLAYTASDKTNVVFFKEAEDIATLTATSGGGTTTRCSFAQGGYADADAVITTLTPGKYVLMGAGYGGNLVFKAGETEVLNMPTAGYWRETPSAEFVVAENTDITFKGGASGGGASLDYVIIQKTADLPATENIVVTSAGYATYVSNYNLDFTSATTKAYKVSVAEKGIATMTEVTQVPAKTPVLLFVAGGNGDGEAIPVITDAVSAVSGNDLVAGDATTASVGVATTDGVYTNMILNNVGGNVGFYFANGQTVAADRAYLHILTSLAPGSGDARGMSLVIADEVLTGINEAEAATEAAQKEGKFVVDGKLRIFSKGKMFNANGQLVK